MEAVQKRSIEVANFSKNRCFVNDLGHKPCIFCQTKLENISQCTHCASDQRNSLHTWLLTSLLILSGLGLFMPILENDKIQNYF